LAGVRARGVSKKIWDLLFISATVEASNFKFGIQIVLGSSLPKNNFYDQNWQGSGLGKHPKKFGTLIFIFAVIEASKFKLGIQVGFGE